MMRADRRPTRRVPISRYLLAFLVAALMFLSASAVIRRGETASNSTKQLARGSTSTSWLTVNAPRLASAEIAMLSLLSSLHGSPAAPNPLEPLLVSQASDDIVISQVYGGGGNSGSTYQNDYVELFNQGTTTISLNGWTVNYAAANGNTWQTTTLSGSLAPGHYYLVQEDQGAGGTQQLPLSDASGTTALNATDGKVALLNGPGCLNGTSDPNGSDCEWNGTVIVDLVGYGSGTTSYEGSGPTVSPSNISAILRGASGCIDLNDNKSDFDAGSPSPRNSGSLSTQCVAPSSSTTVVISEFRTRGLNGGNDEFVELYNKTSESINIGGWKLKASNNTGSITTRFTIPANTTLPAHRHYLATNNNSLLGYNGTITGDQTYGVGIADNGGIAITRADDSLVDQTGMNIGSAFKEGRILDPFTTNTARSYERKLGGVSGSEQDTDDSRSDFLIRMTSDPQNLQSSPVPASGLPAATGVKIIHIDVGQGDATLIIGPTRALLFDAGITGSSAQILHVLNANGITSLDYFVAGNYHADHVGAIDEVILGGITVGTSYDRGGSYSTQAFTEYIAAVGASRSTIALNQQIDLGGGAILTCIAMDGQTNHGTVGSSDENDRSIALVLRYGTFDYLIASDSTGGGNSTANVEAFYARDAGDIDVLHVNHHGSNTSTNQILVDTLRAQQAVISLGNGNSYGHPTQSVLDRLSAPSIMDTIWQTEIGAGGTSSKVRVGGNITFATDGSIYSVTNSLNGLKLSYSTDGITGVPLPGPAAVAGGPYAGNVGTTIGFNGNGSHPGGTIVSHKWNFGDAGSGTGATPNHTYTSGGMYNVTLTVTDNTGAMSSAQTTAVVNNPPTVTLTSPGHNAVFPSGSTIALSADAADIDGQITKVEFLQGSTIVGEDTTAPYTSDWSSVGVGNYAITARATDNAGAIITSSVVNIVVNTNQLPIADPNGPYSALSGSQVHFTGSSSMDSDGTIANYQWNFGDNTSGTGEVVSHAYSSVGSYSALLTVTDNLGGTATASTTVVITSPSNNLPTANPGGPYTAVTGHPVQFNGSSSYDSDGSIAAYHWEFADSGTAEGATPTHSFASAGTHLVSLKVTDNEGATSWTGLNIKVTQSGSGNQVNSSPNDVSWDPGNRDSLDDPVNDRGNQANDSAGNNNFQLTAPVLSLPGRGLDLNLNLIYNSLVWNKAGDEMAYDLDQDWPAPGWQLGFGKMVAMGGAGALLIEPDGTRHSLTGTVFNDSRPPPLAAIVPTFTGRTTDGSLIEYRCEGLTGSGLPRGVARYPDGTIVSYSNFSTDFSVPHTYLYPYQIMDANGNLISIKYLWDLREPRIERIIDSVGRVITFHYDTQKRLTRVTAPGLPDASGNPTTQTFVRLHYATKALDLNGAFTTPITRVRNSSPTVIDAIYYPATGTGYWLPANDAYSSYGMLKKVVEQRGMGFSGSADPNDQGTISPGTMTRQKDYDYPSAPSALNSAPTFSNLTETWDGGTAANVTSFVVQINSATNERTVTITRPDQTKGIQKSYHFANPSEADKFRNGLVKEEQTLAGNGNLLQKTIFVWEAGVDQMPRLQRLETTDERGAVLTTEYDQFGTNNSVGRVRERDYDGSIIRTTLNTFVSYVDSDIDLRIGNGRYWPRRINLVDSVKVFAGDDQAANKVLAASSKYEYDVYAQTLQAYSADPNSSSDLFVFGESRQTGGIKGVVQHSGGFNPLPFSTDGGAGENYITRRGNITRILSYADTTNPDQPANPVTESRTYDMVGNVIASSKACCDQISSVFELDMQYAFPSSQTRGSSDPNSLQRITTSATYDLKTGLQLSQKDANGRMSESTYDPISLRPKEIISPTNARTSFEYDDSALKFTQTTRLSPNGPIAEKKIKYLNGLGQVRREEALAVQGINGSSDIWDVVTTTFDQFGRLSRQSRPYRGSDGQHWKEVIYDSVGRVSESREPAIPAAGGGEESSIARGEAPGWGGGESPTAGAGAHEMESGGSIKPTTKYFYNEEIRPQGASSDLGQTTRTVDPWNRWRWVRLDSSGRLAEVVEPNPAGGTGFQTKYTYDTLGKLTKVEQGDQIRRFRYDSLGRLTHQKLAETSPTLNSAGQWDETGNPDDKWSNVLTYDQRSNMITSTDARGVKTTYKYKDSGNNEDPLNRLQSISYDLSGVPSSLTVLPAATVGYQYRTRASVSDRIDLTQVQQIVATDVNTESFDYDDQGRVENKRFTFAGKSQPMTTTYAYDTLGRLHHVTYPEQYHDNAENPARKIVTPSYDIASRLVGLKVNNIDYGSQINYNSSSQITSIEIGIGANKISESYSYEPPTGLVSTQTVKRGATTLMNLLYEYREAYCEGPGLCIALPESYLSTGQVTRVTNSAPGQGKTQHFSYDSLGRLIKADQSYYVPPPTEGIETDWTQAYSYDRFGNRTGVIASNTSGVTPVPQDGIQSLTYDIGNRITSAGFSYDPAGNQLQNNTGQSFVYDAAGRLAKVKNQSAATVATYTYGASNHRLVTQSGSEASTDKTYYLWEGNSVIAEYSEQISASMPQWAKNYIYLGGRLLATEEPNGAGGELVQYHHPDRLGTRLVTNSVDTTSFTQTTLPYGTSLDSYPSGATNRRFTSYDRSSTTGLDYAVNRQYDSRQGRFTQADPLGMGATSLADPQSLNMYSYVGNDPMNRVDPDGQFWGALFRFIGGLFSSLKPNIINGSFAYGNRPPVSVSFAGTGNINMGYAGIGIALRTNGQWLPDFLKQRGGDNGEYKRELTEEEWDSLNPIFDAVRAALANPSCAQWITDDIKLYRPNPTNDLNQMIKGRQFFYGGSPGSIATTYLNGGGFLGNVWIGLRKTFFRDSYWEKINTILHELRHASSLGTILHPESFKTDAQKVSWIQGGGVIETQKGFNVGVKKNCIDPLKKAMGKL
jgi:RHS repeat-associated protein